MITTEFPGLGAYQNNILADGTDILGIHGENRRAGRKLLCSGSQNYWFHDVLDRREHILIYNAAEQAINQASLIQRVVELYDWRPIEGRRLCHLRSTRRGHCWIRGRGK